MTGMKDWFVNINKVFKNKVIFTCDSTLVEDGIGDVSINGKNGENSLIK